MHISSAPAWTMKGRGDEKDPYNTPGPGNYDPKSSKFENSPNIKIGTSSRSNLFVPATPGPGAYETRSSVEGRPAPKIGSSKRPPLSDTVETPGPGTYELRPSAVEGPKYSMPGRTAARTSEHSPGPGHYEHAANDVVTKERTPKYKFGSEPRNERPSSAYVPGPGTYDQNHRDKGPKWGFGSQSRENLFKIDVPGPGTYSMPESLGKKSWTMTGRGNEHSPNGNPGPGTYNPSAVRPKSPNWSIGKSPRGDFTSNNRNAPGPGTYDLRKDIGKNAPLFGTSTRPPLSDTTDTPGPGQYNAPKASGPAYSMRPRTANTKKDAFPGPGQYNPSASSGNIRWTIGKEARAQDLGGEKQKYNPGPGHYNLSGKTNGPQWGFGSGLRSKDVKGFTPGPGYYDTYSTVGNLPGYARTSR